MDIICMEDQLCSRDAREKAVKEIGGNYGF